MIATRNKTYRRKGGSEGEADDCDCSKCDSRRKRAAAQERAARRDRTP